MIRVRGVEALLAGISPAKANEAETNVSNELEDIARDTGRTAAQNAPVLTGALRNYAEMGVSQINAFHIELNPDIYGNIPYFWRQNFEHKTKGYFFTNAFNQMQAQFGDRLQKAVDRTW